MNDSAYPQIHTQNQKTAHNVIMEESEANLQSEASVESVDAGSNAVDKVISQIGHLTRVLHDSLQELGYNKRIEQAASEIPEAQDRLAYVAVMTEKAAERVLSATEVAKPIQDQMAADAALLAGRWQLVLGGCTQTAEGDALKQLASQTQNFLGDIPHRVNATNAQLMEIMMAQDFQDLTGQVIKNITLMVQNLEQELVRLLVDNIPADRRVESNLGLMNGPVVKPEGRTDVVANQNQVDDLLASLGF